MIAWQQWLPYAKLLERWRKGNSTKIYQFLVSLRKVCEVGFDNIFIDTKNGQTGSSEMVGCNPLQYIDGLQSGEVVKSKSDEQLHCFPQTFSED